MVGLERALLSYVEAPTGAFDLKAIPVETVKMNKPMDDEEGLVWPPKPPPPYPPPISSSSACHTKRRESACLLAECVVKR